MAPLAESSGRNRGISINVLPTYRRHDACLLPRGRRQNQHPRHGLLSSDACATWRYCNTGTQCHAFLQRSARKTVVTWHGELLPLSSRFSQNPAEKRQNLGDFALSSAIGRAPAHLLHLGREGGQDDLAKNTVLVRSLQCRSEK